MSDSVADRSSQAWLRKFTLRDMFTAMVVVSLFMALVLVYIPYARDQARSMSCSKNLKMIGIGLHNYHDTYQSFPIGSRGAGDTRANPTATHNYASSWVVGIDEFAELIALRVPWDHESGNGLNAKDLTNSTFNMQRVDGWMPYYLRCPSSPLPELVLIGKHGTPNGRLLPTYVGVAGGVPQPGWKYQDPNRVIAQSGPATGILASNGTLLANDCIAIKDVLDGLYNTIMVVEQSDYHQLGINRKLLVHSSANVGAWCGAKGNGIVGHSATASNPAAWNLTSIRYPVQTKRHKALPAGMFGPADTVHLGNNNGIFSAHNGGANAALADGSVRLLSKETDLEVLIYGSIRDDRVALELP